MEHKLLIWFCNKNLNHPGMDANTGIGEAAFNLSLSSNQLSTNFWFEGDMVASMSISHPMLQNVEKTISLKVKNPLNFMADYATVTGNTDSPAHTHNPMGAEVVGGWNDVVVSDGEFIVFKGDKADWAGMTDENRTKALLGIFYVEKVSYDQFEQTFTISGRDAMALARRWAIWNKPMNFPPKDSPLGPELYVGQIIHFLFHWIGAYHHHKDIVEPQRTVIDKGPWNNNRVLVIGDFPLITEPFYSTNMSFKSNGVWAEEQVAENKLVGDVWATFLQYTGYKIYVNDQIISGKPCPVFTFEPPAYKLWSINDPTTDNTLPLFGSYTTPDLVVHDVTVLDSLFYLPTTTHINPITITGITHDQDVDPVRYAIKVSVLGKSLVVSDDGFVGVQRMRAGRDRIGVVVESDIDAKYCSSIAEAVLFQVRELYSVITVNWSDAIKFAPRLYNFNIDENSNGINIKVGGADSAGMMQCTKSEIRWSGTKYDTSSSFTPFDTLAAHHDFPKPVLQGTAGNGEVTLTWTPFEENGQTAVYAYAVERRTKIAT